MGIKSAVGELAFWDQTSPRLMAPRGDRGVDFITIDGGEGGTGAGPLVFTDHVALPFKHRLQPRSTTDLRRHGLHHKDVVFIGSGKLGFPGDGHFLPFAMGCDMINVAREAMMAIGCIQAQRCHTGHCPTGVATQSKWLMRGRQAGPRGAGRRPALPTPRSSHRGVSMALPDGSRICSVTLSPGIPAKDFWSFVLYDPQTRSLLQTPRTVYPSLSSQSGDVKMNADGSCTVWFGPHAPEGQQSNWIQTVPGKGFFVILRLYGPLESWFDHTWKPGELEQVS